MLTAECMAASSTVLYSDGPYANNKATRYVGLCDFFTLCLMGLLQENVDGQG
jgi:hypothetical protein